MATCSRVGYGLAVVFAILFAVMLVMYLIEKRQNNVRTYSGIDIKLGPGESMKNTYTGPLCLSGDLVIDVEGVPNFADYKL